MRIMVIGDSASGKSTFSVKLGKKIGIDPWHLDVDMDSLGRHNRDQIGEVIREYVDTHPDWIIEGNAFTKDKTYRLENTDVVVVFEPARIITLFRVVKRYLRQKTGKEQRVGSQDATLDLVYYIPYIFWKFPSRRKRAANYARDREKQVHSVKNYRAADSLINNWNSKK